LVIWQAFLVTVRNKKRVGYTYELSLKFKGEWLIEEENKKVKGHLEIPEFSFGELEDLEVKTRFCIEFLSIGIEVYNLIHPMEITILEGKKRHIVIYAEPGNAIARMHID